MKSIWIYAGCAIFMLGMWWHGSNLEQRLAFEQDAHLQTQKQLTSALGEIQRWQVVAGETLIAANSQKQLAEACLAREAESRADEEARKAILAPTKPRPRTVAEKQQVVDDATRSRAIDRLNRGL